MRVKKKEVFSKAFTSRSLRDKLELLESSSLPPVAIWLMEALQDAGVLYRAKQYTAAADLFSTALQDCSKGVVLAKDAIFRNVHFEDLSKVLGFIESRLAACYLKMEKTDLALLHSHRSICQNPIHFRSHLQQAMVYRLLGNRCMAVRSAMIADYVHWLCGDSNATISNRIKLRWQKMLEEAVLRLTDFSILYTPCSGKPTREEIEKAEHNLRELSPNFTAYIYTDPDGGHVLPNTTDWSKSSITRYFLTLGFQRKQDGIFLNKLLHKNSHMITGLQDSFMLLTPDSPENMCETFEKKILPVLDFINCNKLTAGFSTGSGVIERLQYADCLYELGKEQEHMQVLEQTLAELAVAPYLQDVSPSEICLLQRLNADIMNTIEGGNTDQLHAWNKVEPAENMDTTLISPSSKPSLVILRTNSSSHMYPHPQPTHPKQIMFTHPYPQQPHPQQIMFTHPHPQQIMFTHPYPQQPHPQQIMFTHPYPQQPHPPADHVHAPSPPAG